MSWRKTHNTPTLWTLLDKNSQQRPWCCRPMCLRGHYVWLSVSLRYYTRCYFNVRSKADMSQLNLALWRSLPAFLPFNKPLQPTGTDTTISVKAAGSEEVQCKMSEAMRSTRQMHKSAKCSTENASTTDLFSSYIYQLFWGKSGLPGPPLSFLLPYFVQEWWGVGVVICSEVQIVCIWSSWCHCIPKPHYLLSHLNPDWFHLSGTGLPTLSLKTGWETGVRVCIFSAREPLEEISGRVY